MLMIVVVMTAVFRARVVHRLHRRSHDSAVTGRRGKLLF